MSSGDKTPQSTLHFILRSPAAGGIRRPGYILIALFGFLMSAIVSFYVTQQSRQDRLEFVSEQLLQKVEDDVSESFEQHKSNLPDLPNIPLVKATAVSARSLFHV
ncbi:hypothetical protein ACN47E_007556 [Coniothyrium glycines]